MQAIAYLHDNYTCHRDIKPSNILITKDNNNIILVDFNVAKRIREGEIFHLYTKGAGTLAFAAPERIRDNCVYNEKVDMWAAGLVLFMLLVGRLPFEDNGSTAKLID